MRVVNIFVAIVYYATNLVERFALELSLMFVIVGEGFGFRWCRYGLRYTEIVEIIKLTFLVTGDRFEYGWILM